MAVDINALSGAALAAAMRGGTEAWGQWGSAHEHVLYVEPFPKDSPYYRRRRMCRCGCRKRITHIVMANGVGLGWGCEMEAHRFRRKFSP